MRISHYVLAAALVGAVAAAQVPMSDPAPREVAPTATPSDAAPTNIPDIPAGTEPMDREPDPAEGTAAAISPPRGSDSRSDDTRCRVERADTDTGFVVVCE